MNLSFINQEKKKQQKLIRELINIKLIMETELPPVVLLLR